MDEEKKNKLPKWVRERLEELERQRDVALRTLNEFCDNQRPSPIYIEENPCTGEKTGLVQKRHYIQSQKVEIVHAGVWLWILCREDHIDLKWGDENQGSGNIGFIPTGYQGAILKSKQNMR